MNNGHFGKYGGAFVPETLVPALQELQNAYDQYKEDEGFKAEFKHLLKTYVGRPSPLYFANNLSEAVGCKVYLKREDLNHTGAHKINNTLGQILLAKRMGKKRIIAETGAGQHGVATATVCALVGMPCVIYMGEEDMKRQALNVYRIQLLGAKVEAVTSGSKTLKDATTQAIRDWMHTVEDTHYIIGSVLGPHPYPEMVRDFQRVIGEEAKEQILEAEGQLPSAIIACVGGGSNAIGIFHPFLEHNEIEFIVAEAGGTGDKTGEHAASLSKGTPGVLHGGLNYLLQTKTGQVAEVHSISAGLDYPGVSPELSNLKDDDRLSLFAITDKEALEACKWLSIKEGIIPALESAHAIAALKKKPFKSSDIVIVNVSGRGDKDMETIRSHGV